MKRLVLSLALVLTIVGVASAQSQLPGTVFAGPANLTADQAAIDVLLTVFAPLTVAAARDLDYGHVVIGAGNVVVDASATSTYGQSGHFAIAGNAGATVNISTTQGAALGTGITWTPAISLTGSQVLGGGGSLNVYVGGTLNVGTSAVAGDYGTTFTLDVAYTSI